MELSCNDSSVPYHDQGEVILKKTRIIHNCKVEFSWSEEDQKYTARVPEIHGVVTYGVTLVEATENAELAIARHREPLKVQTLKSSKVRWLYLSTRIKYLSVLFTLIFGPILYMKFSWLNLFGVLGLFFFIGTLCRRQT